MSVLMREPLGSFMVRNSTSQPGTLALSLRQAEDDYRDEDDDGGDADDDEEKDQVKRTPLLSLSGMLVFDDEDDYHEKVEQKQDKSTKKVFWREKISVPALHHSSCVS